MPRAKVQNGKKEEGEKSLRLVDSLAIVTDDQSLQWQVFIIKASFNESSGELREALSWGFLPWTPG